MYKLDKRNDELVVNVKMKDKKVTDLKTIISSLTTNNNEMLNVLTSKVISVHFFKM